MPSRSLIAAVTAIMRVGTCRDVLPQQAATAPSDVATVEQDEGWPRQVSSNRATLIYMQGRNHSAAARQRGQMQPQRFQKFQRGRVRFRR